MAIRNGIIGEAAQMLLLLFKKKQKKQAILHFM